MSQISSYVVRKPTLWFKAVGRAQPDVPHGLHENDVIVYQSTLASFGDRFHVADGRCIHQSASGEYSLGAMRLGTAHDENAEMTRLIMTGVLRPDVRQESVPMPEIPQTVFPANHGPVVRDASSPAFAEMMFYTEELRLECFEDGDWSVMCSDYGVKRTVVFTVAEAEAGTPVIRVELDPATEVADIAVMDTLYSQRLVGALAAEAISLEGKPTIRVCGWNYQAWEGVQSALQTALLDRRPVRGMAVGMTA
jgi:hypothetical protein